MISRCFCKYTDSGFWCRLIMQVSSANVAIFVSQYCRNELIYIRYKMEPRTLPCETPALMTLSADWNRRNTFCQWVMTSIYDQNNLEGLFLYSYKGKDRYTQKLGSYQEIPPSNNSNYCRVLLSKAKLVARDSVSLQYPK